jgi:hypothetical protein
MKNYVKGIVLFFVAMISITNCKKAFILGAVLVFLMGITAACAGLADFQSGAQHSLGASQGYKYIGDTDSEDDCIEACRVRGYTSYLWGYSTKHCQCK